MEFVRTRTWIYTFAVFIVCFEGALLQDLTDCYAPIKMAYVISEPEGGANGDLSPVILLHGLGVAKEYFLDFPQHVADRTKRKVYNLDARNSGDSEWSDCFNFDVNALDVLHFMDEQGIDKAVIIGHSMGGTSAIKVALQAPDRVEKVFVEDMYTKVVPFEDLKEVVDFWKMWEKYVDEIPTDLNEDEAQQYMADIIRKKEIVKPHAKPVLPLKRGDGGRYTFKTNLEVIYRTLLSEGSTMSENKGQYEGPAYFMYGMDSIYKVFEEEEDIRKYFPNAEFIGFKADHNIRLNLAEEYEEVVIRNLMKEDS